MSIIDQITVITTMNTFVIITIIIIITEAEEDTVANFLTVVSKAVDTTLPTIIMITVMIIVTIIH